MTHTHTHTHTHIMPHTSCHTHTHHATHKSCHSHIMPHASCHTHHATHIMPHEAWLTPPRLPAMSGAHTVHMRAPTQNYPPLSLTNTHTNAHSTHPKPAHTPHTPQSMHPHSTRTYRAHPTRARAHACLTPSRACRRPRLGWRAAARAGT